MSRDRAVRTARRGGAAVLAGALALTTATFTGTAAAEPEDGDRAAPARDIRSAGEEIHKRRTVDLSKAEQEEFADQAAKVRKANRTASARSGGDDATGTPIGGEKTWLGLDDTRGYFAASYVLRGVGDNIEVWVQKNLDYPQGDCRNDGVRNVVTDEQVSSLVQEFDENILPKESEAFSVAPERDGTQQQDVGFGAPLWEILGNGDPDYFKGDGENTVVLVSNVRDANYYDPTSPEGSTYIAGFFSPLYNEGFDRNVMTIDSYDWLHRTGANPPDEGDGGLCSTEQPARPRLYEGVFAHEYQHLLEYYEDADETAWLNEGLADYAQTLVGYVDTTIPYPEKGADSHITCFQGWAGTSDFPYCGAENSLTRWGDQGGTEILADYGAAYSFVTYLTDKFGARAATYLHRHDANGLASVQQFLDDHAPGLRASQVVHDWSAAMALDGLLDDGARGLARDQQRRFGAAQLSSTIDWAWTGSYDSAGAPTNGSDYVLARKNRPLNEHTIGRVRFTGGETFAPHPMAWQVDAGTQAVWSGVGRNLDRSMVYQVTVPEDDPQLTFSTKYDLELGWDFGMVQVSADGGETYESLSNADTTSEHASGAVQRIVEQLPGFTGLQEEFTPQTFDLSEYAGQTVYLSFRKMTDPSVNGNGGEGPYGWWVKDVKVGDTVVTDGTTTEGAQSASQIAPTEVEDWNVQLVGWSLDGSRVAYKRLRLGDDFTGRLSKAQTRKTFRGVDRIGVIVSVDDTSESVDTYANYRLWVNKRLQPGGGGDTNAKKPPKSKQLSLR